MRYDFKASLSLALDSQKCEIEFEFQMNFCVIGFRRTVETLFYFCSAELLVILLEFHGNLRSSPSAYLDLLIMELSSKNESLYRYLVGLNNESNYIYRFALTWLEG